MPRTSCLVLVLALGLCACGQDGIAFTTGTGGSSSETTSSAAPSSTTSSGGGSASGGASSSGGASAQGGSTNTNTSSSSASTTTVGGSSASGGGGGNAAGSGGAATGGASTTSSTGGGGSGGGGVCTPLAGGPTIAQTGTSGLLLRGLVVTPDVPAPFQGEVLLQGDTIICVAASCAGAIGAANATVVETNGIIMPGLIDTHNHILFDIFDETDWSPSHGYTNHNQWTSDDPKYTALVNAKQYLNGEGSPSTLNCAMDKYGELKGLVAGTTSIIGAANPAGKKCYGSLARTIDQSPNGLTTDKMQVATLFPDKTAADGVCDNFTSMKTTSYVIHVGEGIDATARNEFTKLGAISGTTPLTYTDCLYTQQTTIVHGASFQDAEFTTMAQHGMSLVWSPKSNVFLYGGGTDLTATADVPLAQSKGINVALAPDWSIGGSVNLLDELRFAKKVSDGAWAGSVTEQQLFEMVTINAAKAMALDGQLGSLTVNKRADVMVISGDTTAPLDALLAATPREVRLVVVGGTVLYGDAGLEALGPAQPGCEPLDICDACKFACVATTTTTDELNETFAQFRKRLVEGLAAYDAMHVDPYRWSPIAPLVKCP